MCEVPYFIRPELLPVIEATPEQTTWDLSAMRAGGDALLAAPYDPENTLEVTSLGRAFIPKGVSDDAPLLVSIHGGGYVAGRAAFDDAKNDELASRFGAIVISPEYRLAPEYPFPAAVDDCISSLKEVVQRFGEHRGIFIFGDSAGAGLAYSMVSRIFGVGEKNQNNGHVEAKDALASAIRGIILLEPCIDPDLATPSSTLFADGPIWTRRAAADSWRHFYGLPLVAEGDGQVEEIPSALKTAAFPVPSPVFNEKGFPPALIVVNPVDPLRDEGISLATGLVSAGCISELHMFAGTFHGSLSLPDSVTWAEIQILMGRFMSENSERN